MKTPWKRVLIVDDDDTYRERLARSLSQRGCEVATAADLATAEREARRLRPGAAIVDLRLPSCSGIDLLKLLLGIDPSIKVVILTGYGSIANAIEAVRLGAWDYLNKPADADQVLAALSRENLQQGAGSDGFTPPSLARLEWEHIQRVLADCDGNISKAAEALGLHRRTLQRKLGKQPPGN